MGISPIDGKFFSFFLVFSLSFFLLFDGFLVNSDFTDINNNDNTPLLSEDHHNELIPKCNPEDVIDNKQAQIDKLEELVKNLSDLVTRLESGFPFTHHKFESLEKRKDKGDRSSSFSNVVEDDEEEEESSKVNNKRWKKTGRVTKYSPFWSEKFQFMSAVHLDSFASCVTVLPFKDFEGFAKYIAVGDDRGRVYVFLRNGDVLVEFYTLSASPVTAMLTYMSPFLNESVLVTGHSDGVILTHRLWETSVSEDLSSLHMENLAASGAGEVGSDRSSVSILEVHQVGRSKYILSVDDDGKIRVFRENGTLYGLAVPTSRPLAFLKQRLLFLTEKGAGSLDLRTMKIRETECEGLNDSLVKNYVFDATERSKAYGFTSSGELIHVLLLGDVMNFKCRIRSRKKFDMDEPLAFQAIKGYLLITGQEKIHVYNVSTQHYIRSGAPRLTFSATIEEIKSSFLPSQMVDGASPRENAIPLIASDREKLVILGLGGGYVGMYRSKLPVFKGDSNTMLWTSPVLFFILFLFGAWLFFAKKKEALTSWGPDDPFNSASVTTGAPLGSGPGDRSFTDSSSRSADIMELRNNGLRGPSRRYTSPSRYPGGGGSTFRPNSVDTGSRPPSVDPNYRATTELKFRGSNLDSTAFPNRRDNMFANSQVGDEGN